MLISLYNYVMAKKRLTEIDKTINMFDSDNYPVQLLAQKDMLKYEEEHWREEFHSNFALSVLAICIIFAAFFVGINFVI